MEKKPLGNEAGWLGEFLRRRKWREHRVCSLGCGRSAWELGLSGRVKQAAPLLLSSTFLGLVIKYKLGNTGIPYLTQKNINTDGPILP